MDTTAVAKDLQAKREGELSELKRNIEEETKQHETAMQQLRSKHSNLVEELNSQLDNMKRVRSFCKIFNYFIYLESSVFRCINGFDILATKIILMVQRKCLLSC